MRKIILFGDSLTQFGQGPNRVLEGGGPGWADRLVELCARRADVYNRGCFGYNTRDALKTNLVDDTISTSSEEVMLATVLFGSNDACDIAFELNGKHVELTEYEANLTGLVVRAKKISPRRVVVFTPPAMSDEKYVAFRIEVNKPMDRSNALLSPYIEVCKRVAANQAVPCIDLHTPTTGRPEIFMKDGLHFSALGDALVFSLLCAKLDATWPELQIARDPFNQSSSNSGSISALKPAVPFWDNYFNNAEPPLKTEPEKWKLNRGKIVLLGDSITQQAQGNPAWIAEPQEEHAGWGDMVSRMCVSLGSKLFVETFRL
jgi:lysophospholipase L1-like esterase